MSHNLPHWLWKKFLYANEKIIPGRGKLFGINPKYDIITPVDVIPVVGPLNKLNRLRKLAKISKVRWLWLTVFGPGDLLMAKEGYDYLIRRRESGAPSTSTPKAPTKAISRSSIPKNPCPRGMRWDRKKGKCVRLHRR